ncbi:MAG: hypothetical protein LBC90_05250 [Candidatus Adiutrix sp.]|jgi:hypothetical protein|nr:hypothetical protein [Candidatus Adiutrix sp.]
MNGSFFSDLRARAILGGLFGAAFAIFDKINIFSAVVSNLGPFSLGLTIVVVIIAATLVKKWRDPDKTISKIVRFFLPQVSTWYFDLTAVLMYLAGVCLGALLIDLILNLFGFGREIFQFFLMTCVFGLASFVLHRYSSRLNRESALPGATRP